MLKKTVSQNKQALVVAGGAAAGAGVAALCGLGVLGTVLSAIGGGLIAEVVLTGLSDDEEEK